MARGLPSAADLRIVDFAARHGVDVSHARLERWRQYGALPRNTRRGRGRGRGSISTVSDHALHLAVAYGKRARPGRAVDELVLEVFVEEPETEVPEAAVRAALTWYAHARLGGILRAAHLAARSSDDPDDAEDAAAGAAERYLASKSWTVRSALRAVPEWQGMDDLALAAAVGDRALGADQLSAALRRQGVFDGDLLAEVERRVREREQAGDLSGPSPMLSPEHQVEAIARAGGHDLRAARDIVLTLAVATSVYDFFRSIDPDDDIVRAAGLVYDAAPGGRVLPLMFSARPETGFKPPWAVACKLIVACVVVPGTASYLKLVATELAEVFGGRMSEAMDRLGERMGPATGKVDS